MVIIINTPIATSANTTYMDDLAKALISAKLLNKKN
ncbi:hypothetical protein CCP2SC5_360003 [Azospirillaceae bacterium]